MARKSTIKLLLINESDNESERIVSLFRNAGRVARAQRAHSAEELFQLLDQMAWDLIIANDKHPEIGVDQCLEQLGKSDKDIPVIVLRKPDADVTAAQQGGAADVVNPEDDSRLVFAAFRELHNLEQRRQLVDTRAQLAEAEQRCDMLLADSQDAIAYVADGMLISANDVFAERFDYSNTDDLDCLPIIDLIADCDHEKFKAMLKAQAGSDETAELSINGLKQGGESFSTTIQLASATFDGEPCVQLTLRDAATAGNSPTSLHHEATGLYNGAYFLSQLDNLSKLVAANSSAASLLFIRVNKYAELRSRLGINHTEQALIDLAQFIQSQCDQKYCLAHYCDDAFALLLDDLGVEQAKELAQLLCRSIEGHIIELNSQSIQVTVSIGIIPIEPSISGHGHIDNAFFASEQVSNNTEVYIPPKERKSLGDANNDTELDATLAEAIEDGLFQLRYQPVVSLRGSAGDHYEVQVVMQDGENIKTADEFLHSLNFAGVNTRLDRWVILEATKELAAKRDSGEDIRLFINLTYQALLDDSLIPWLSVALKAGNLPAEALIFQFTESEIASNLKPAISFSAALQDIGCRLSIADFGRMDDPLKNYKHVNANFTKLCAKFTNELDNGGDSQALKAIVGSINESGGKAIIPNLQKAAALAVLWQVGADYIQGDYLAPQLNEMNYEFTDIA